MLVGVLDLGINNLSSVQRAFSAPLTQADSIVIVNQGEEEERPNLLILPGLGKFSAGMAALQERNLVGKIGAWKNDGTKVVGICLGMQLLATESDESPGVEGLNLIKSRVKKLRADGTERIPHIGWAEVLKKNEVENFPSLATPGDFYFVHSYHLLPENKNDILTETQFGQKSFVSSVISTGILGFQFHPEKSGAKGKALITEIIQWAR